MSPLVWDLAHIGHYEELWLLRNVVGRRRPTSSSTTSTTRSSTRAATVRQLPILGPRGRARSSPVCASRARRARDDRPRRRRSAGARRLRVRNGRPARAPARRDDARHHPARWTTSHPTPTTGADARSAHRRRPFRPRRSRRRRAVRDRHRRATPGPTTTSAAPRGRRCRRSGSTARRSPTAPASRSSTTAATTTAWWSAAGGLASGGRGRGAAVLAAEGAATGRRRRFGRREELPPDEPVQHVCWYEADAAPRGASHERGSPVSPTEAEWETAARTTARAGGRAADARRRVGVDGHRLRRVPRLRVVPVPRVLRGVLRPRVQGAAAAGRGRRPGACRATFRNWDYPIRRQIFAGFRCAPTNA